MHFNRETTTLLTLWLLYFPKMGKRSYSVTSSWKNSETLLPRLLQFCGSAYREINSESKSPEIFMSLVILVCDHLLLPYRHFIQLLGNKWQSQCQSLNVNYFTHNLSKETSWTGPALGHTYTCTQSPLSLRRTLLTGRIDSVPDATSWGQSLHDWFSALFKSQMCSHSNRNPSTKYLFCVGMIISVFNNFC